MRRKAMTAVILITLVMTGSALAQTVPVPATPAGKRLAEFLSVVETGDGARMRAFMHGFAKSFLERLPEDKHMQFFKQIHDDEGGLAIVSIDESKDYEVVATAKGKRTGQYVQLTLRTETSPPHRINGIRLTLTRASQDQSSRSSDDSHMKKSEPETLAELEKYLDRLVKADEFAGTVLVAKNGHPIFRKAYGLASREYSVPNRVDTKFNLGSINKIFTQIAIGQLIEQGKLSLDDTIGRHLPDYPNRQAQERVTIRHLLDMSSGIGDIFNEKYRSTPKDRIRTIEDYLPLFASEPLAFEPGTRRQYSNGGYIVLGAIIEKVSGQSYYDYVREHIFKPAGMEHTDYYQADDIVPNCASGYTRWGKDAAKDAPLRNNFYTRPARGSSAGGGYATVDDLLKFVHALESHKLLIPNFRAQASAPSATDQPSGSGGLSIGGGAPGINAVLDTQVAGAYTIIVISNLDPPSASMVAKQIRTWLGTGEN